MKYLPMPTSHYTLAKLEEIYDLSMHVARAFPDPASVQPGIYELLINALEHGNLGMGHVEKAALIRQNRWEDEIKRRLTLPGFRNRLARVTLQETDRECRLTITDQGNGFDWRPYMSSAAGARNRLDGLGLWLVRHAGFDKVSFNDTGNEVRCMVWKAI